MHLNKKNEKVLSAINETLRQLIILQNEALLIQYDMLVMSSFIYVLFSVLKTHWTVSPKPRYSKIISI